MTIVTLFFTAFIFFASTASAAETAVDTSIFATNSSGLTGAPAAVCVDDQNCFVFYLDSGGGISMASTTDGGTTWTGGRNVDSVNTADAVSVGIWWEGWTPGTSTTRYIHIATTDTGVDDTYYTRYDITNNTFSTTVLATTQAAACTLGADCYPTITMTSDGALYMATAEATDRWVVKCVGGSACTTPGPWSEITGGFQGTNGDDYPILMPIPGTNNILLTWWDISADAIYYNIYSATSSSWWKTTTVSVATAADDNTTYDAQLMGMAIASSTGQIVLTFVDDANDYTTVDHDIKFYTYASTTGWTAKTDVVTNAGGGIVGAKVAYDAQSGTWYVIYGRRTEIATATTGKIYYRYSTNGGTTWSTEKGPVNSTADDINALTIGITTNERIAAFWNYTTAPNQDDLYCTTVSDIYRSLTVSGVLYEADRSTPVGSSQNLILALATSTPARYATTTLTSSGVYTYELDDLRGVASDRTNAFTLFVDGNASLKASALFTIANTTAITDLDLYQDHVSFYGLDTEVNVSDLYDEYDSEDDSDIQFTASSSLGRLTVADGQTLLVATSTTFHIDEPVVTGGFETATSATVIASSSLEVSGDFVQNGTYRSDNSTGWTARSAAGNNDMWRSVSYGNGLFVAVVDCYNNGGGDCLMTSPDGVTWTARSVAGNNDWWTDVAYGNGLFVAVGYGVDRVMTSPDGITWTTRSAAGNNDSWESVVYGNGLFVAVGNTYSEQVMTSPDGISWTSRTPAEANNWLSVTYGNGLYVAVADSGTNRVMTSPNGITWTARSVPTNYWYSVTYGNGLFVAVGWNGAVMTSPDGITWTSRAGSGTNSWLSVTYGNGLFVAVSGDSVGDRVMTSPDGIIWTSQAAAEANYWRSVTYGNGLFVAVSQNGTNRVMTSSIGNRSLYLTGGSDQAISGDLVATSTLTNVVFSNSGKKTFLNNASTTALTVDGASGTVTAPTLLSVTGGLTNNSVFIAASTTYLGGDFTNSGTYIAGTSTLYFNGGDQSATGTMTGTSALSNVILSGGQKTFLTNASTTDLTIEGGAEFLSPQNFSVSGDYTNNGTTTIGGAVWTGYAAAGNDENWFSVTYGEGLFVAVTDTNWGGSDSVMTSPDGITWTARTPASVDSWRSVTYGDGLFVAVANCFNGGTNCVMTSPDSINWTGYGGVAGNNDGWTSVTYGEGLYVAFSNCFDEANDCVMTSPDGATWTVRNSDLGVDWRSVTYGNGLFVAVGYDYNTYEGAVFTSSDGITWTRRTAVSNLWTSVTYGNGLFVAVGNGGSVMTSPDGITWTARTAAEANVWYSVTYGNGLFVASGDIDAGTHFVMTSPDGITWTARSAASETIWKSVTFGNDTFVAVSDNGVMTSSVSAITFDGVSAQTIDGSLVGASAFGDVTFTNTGVKTFSANASTSDFYIATGATVEAPVVVTIIGDYTNYGTSILTGSSVFFTGGVQQTATGTMIGTSAFDDLTITNTSQEGSSTQSIIFGASASTTGTLTMLSGTSAQFPAGATSTFQNIDLAGSFGHYVTLRSSTPGTQFSFYVPGTQTQVSFVDVKDSNACPITISVFNGIDAGNNTCWDITALLTLSGQLYSYDVTSPLSAVKTLGIMAGTSTLSLQTVTTDSSGFWYYLFPEGHTIDAGTPLLVWVDGDATTHAAVLTKAANDTANIAGLDLYQDHLIVRHEGTGTSTTNTDLSLYDGDDDADLQYTSNSGVLSVNAGTELYVWPEDTFAPGGEVIIHGNASASSTDGSFTLAASSTYTTSATTSIAGNFISDPTATLTNTGVMQFTATTTGKVIDAPLAMGNVLFSNTEAIIFSSSATITDLTVEAGVAIVSPEQLVILGDYINDGTVSYDLGSLWTARSAAGDNDQWNSIAYGNGLFVAVGDCVNNGGDNCVMTSPDGITWTVRGAAGDDDIWWSVTYGNGLFVAVGGGDGVSGGDRVMTSPDGITWTSRTPAEDNYWYSVTYGNGLFVAVGELGDGADQVMTSPDGITWTSRTAAEADWWSSVTYGNSLFVAVTDSGTNRVMTSPDGITWTARTPAEVVAWYDVTYGNGLFVATGFDWDLEEAYVMTSPDGITWTSRTPAISDVPTLRVVYTSNQFVGVGTNWNTNATAVVTSPDGITWTAHATAEENGWFSLAYGNDIVVASGRVNLGTNVVMTSSLPTVIFGGTAQQIATGTLSGASAFGNLTIANTSQEGSTTQSVVFGAVASTTGTFTMLASTSAQFLAGASSTFQNIDLAGAVGQYVVLRSSTPGTQFGFVVLDGQSVSYVDVKDSTACPSTVYANEGTSIDSGNNLCWNFGDILLVGTLYSDEGVSPITSGKTIKLVVGTTTPIASTRVSDGGGEFTFALGSNYLGTSTPLLLFVDGDSVKAALFTKASSSESSISGLDLYQNHVIISQEGSDDPTTIADMSFYDKDNDSDIPYLAATSTISGETIESPITIGDFESGTLGDFYTEGDTNWSVTSATSSSGTYSAKAGTIIDSQYSLLSIATSGPAVSFARKVSSEACCDFLAFYINSELVAQWDGEQDWEVVGPYNLDPGENLLEWEYYKDDSVSEGSDTAWVDDIQIVSAVAEPGYEYTQDAGITLYIKEGKTFMPGGNVTLNGNAGGSLDGAFQLATGASYVAPATTTIAGNFRASSTAILYPYGTLNFTASTTGKTITTSGQALGNVAFNNTQPITFATNATTSDLTISAGATVVAPEQLTVAGDYTNNGTSTYMGTKWTSRTSAADNDWFSVTYGNGLFVAVAGSGTGNRVMTSPDGITWTSRTSAADNVWTSVTYGNGLFVAVAPYDDSYSPITNGIMTSPDGITWTSRTSAADNGWNSVTYGNGLFVAVSWDGTGNRVMTSPDGITWTSRTSAADNQWLSVTYGNGLFVAVSDTYSGTINNRVMTSPDGITWTSRTSAADNDWFSVTYGNGLFVAVSTTGTGNRVMTSPDGITWTSRTSAADNQWISVTYGNGLFVAVSDSGTGNRVMTSGTALTFSGASDQTVSGSLTGASAFNKVVVDTVGTTTFSNNASTSVFSINTGSTAVAPSKLSVFDDYTNDGTFKANGGEVVFLGTRYQTATGTLTATSSFYDLTLTNTSGGTTSPAVIFGAPVTTLNTFTMLPYTSAALLAGATSTFKNVDWQGSEEAPVILRSTSDGDQWYLDIPGSQLNVEYVDVQDSNASSSAGGTVYAASSTDSGNNSNWNFSGALPPETPVGSSTIANHDDTQVPNAFSYQNVTNGSLFAFKLIPESGTATVTNIAVTISGAKNIDTNDFSNIRLYKDHDNDAQYDATDELVSTGSMSLSDRNGTITFTTDFLSTTTANYLVVADWNAPDNGSFMRLSLYQSGVTAIDGDGTQDIYGAVNSVQHNRNNKGGGGGTAAAVGGPAPEGDGDVTGGTEEGGEQVGNEPIPGELIGDDPTYFWPTSHSGDWSNGAYAYDHSNGTYATTNTTNASSSYINHGFSIPASNQITGVEVKLETKGADVAPEINVQLSWNGGTSWTSTKSTGVLTASDTIRTIGGPSDTWGRSWSPGDFSNANFRVRIIAGTLVEGYVYLDAIAVKVYHQATGGGAGGGGEI